MAKSSKPQATPSGTPPGVARTQANRKRRLERTLKAQPNNQQVVRALQDVGNARKAPKVPQWSHSDIALAKLFKYFSGRASPDLFSSNPKVQAQALQYFNPEREWYGLPQGKVSFSLAARARNKYGETVWA